ncbi:MAG TPA: V-type ATPase subunit [Bryobacteraceae bacterium]|nr:V-type ATPase subunit [Bryobacteraceae bacterium]
MNLLRETDSSGFPNDYLITRIRGRRAALIADWKAARAHGLAPGASDERIWEALLNEIEWLYGQMNRALRACFAPVFVLLELKTIVLCLRNREAGRLSEIDTLLTHTLLADSLRQALRGQPDVRSSIARLVETTAGALPGLREAAAAYANHGLRGFEDSLMRGYLAHTAAAQLDPLIRQFLRAFIDLRNVMILYKQLRWGVDDAGAFIEGGTFELSRLAQLLAGRKLSSWEELAKEATALKALPAAASEGALETVLLTSLTGRLRQIGRDRDDAGLVLDYIWRIYVHARNLAVLCHAPDLGEAALERELIA